MKKFLIVIPVLFCYLLVQSQNPGLLKDVFPGATGSSIQQIVKTSNYTFFNAEDNDTDTDRGLYRTDGTPGGTVKLNLSYLPDPPPSPNNYLSTKAEKITALGDKVIFAGDNSATYGEIWSSDGTQAGTIAIERFLPSIGRFAVQELVTLGSVVMYSVVDNNNHTLLKKTDGTIAGTSIVYDFNNFSSPPEAVLFKVVNNILYFIVYDIGGSGEDELWRSDGTNGGTYMVYDFGPNQYVASYIMPAGNNFYVMFVVPGTGNVLWKSDGTAAGTIAMKLISASGNNNYPAHAAIGSTFYFAGLDGNGKELWKTDGTAAGTMMVADINTGAASSNPLNFTVLNNELYFNATTPAEGFELRKFDGSTVSLVKDINPGTGNGVNPGAGPVSNIVVSNGSLLFSGSDNLSGNELWISDGTASNTRMVADLNSSGSSAPAFLTPGNPVFFSANNGIAGSEIYVYDNAEGLNGVRKIYVNDNSIAGDVFTTAVGNNANNGAKTAPVATISYAQSIAQAGDTILIDAGTFTEQITIEKNITIKGAGRDLTYLIKPNTTVAPPGPFTEQGVVQTTQNIGDVFISDMSISGGPGVTPIILQAGGSVKNCSLQGGNQGVFFRVESAVKTAVVENNVISAEFIGVNFAGTGLTASLINNEISTTNPGFSAGVFFGLDFGLLPQCTMANNKFISYSTYGVFGGSINTVIFENSFTGLGSAAIQSFSNATATCNWFGTNDAELIKSKMVGPINYAPWLVSGTDINLSAIGFQPAAGTCTGRQNKFYVNDNSQANDVYTTAVGNNDNNGFSTAPFASIMHAISIAQASDTIVVDAGTYVENVLVNKSLTLRGVKYGQNPGASVDRGNESIIVPAIANTNLNSAIMQPAADNIVIDGFMFDGDNPALTGGVNVNGADANIGCAIYNNGLFASYLTVKNNIVKNTAAYGIGLFRTFGGNPPGPAISGENLFTQNRVDNIGGRGIVFGYSAYGNITNNYISRCANSGTWFSQQSLPNTNNNPSYLSGNTVDGGLLGMQSSGMQPNASAVYYLNNEITGVASNFAGISLLINNNAGAVAANNKISGHNVGIYINATNSASPVLVNNNSITSTALYAIQSVGAFAISAGCNWYGTASRNDIAGKIAGNMVIYTPWLINGTDADAAMGFQPEANACQGQPAYYVNDNSLTGDVFTTATGSNSNSGSSASPFATLEYVVSVAQPGDTIYVDAGTYDLGGLTYLFTKPVTLLGANYQVTPNDPANKAQLNTVRNAESILTNGKFSIASTGISVKGFTVDMGNRTAVELINSAGTNNDFGNFTFSKNILKISNTTAGLNMFAITGKFVTSPALPVTSGYTITDNRFEKSSTATGNTFNFNYVKNIAITSNSFVVSGTTVRAQQVANLGNTGIVDGLVFSGNTVTEATGVIAGNRIAGALISGNKMYNINGPLSTNNNMPESSNIEFSNNEVGNDSGTPFMLYTRSGNSLAGTSNLLKLENNIFTGASTASANQLLSTTNFTINNTVLNSSVILSGNKFTYSGDFSAQDPHFFRPITVRGNLGNVSIENNEITLNNTGTMLPINPATALPYNPAITIGTDNSATAFMSASAVVNINNNKIHGYKNSVAFYDASTGRDAYLGYGNLPIGATVNINNNSFTGDSISINSGAVGEIINATCNWYGFTAAHKVKPKVTETTVNYEPWLTNGTDSDVATGFQPLANVCNGLPVDADIITVTNVNCYGEANGAIEVLIEEGLAPYTFGWSKDGVIGFSTNEDLTNLAIGVYQLIVTDANGSTDTVSATVTAPAVLSGGASGTNVSCFAGSNGSAAVTAAGGTSPYTFVWSNTATTSSINNLVAGNYSVIITDANGCTAVAAYLVTEPPVLTVTMSGTNASCNGSATATPAGGTAPYTYIWSNGSNTSTILGVPNGTYTVIVTDANNCTVAGAQIVNGNSPINPSVQVIDVNCFGDATGSITVTGAGGQAPHTYSLNGSPYQSSNVFAGLIAGVYTVAAKDASGCYDFVTKTITESPLLTVVQDSVRTACFAVNNGRIDITVNGGSGGKSYSWTGPNGYTSTAQDQNNIAAGTYTLNVSDSKGCTAGLTVVVPSWNIVTITDVTTNIACRGAITGAINLTVTGGAGNGFSFGWTGPGGFISSTEDISGLASGNYKVTVTDLGSGCSLEKTIAVSQPASNLNVSTSKTNATGCNSLGTITATGSGGTPGYQYSLNGVNYQPSGSFAGLYAGDYTVWVKDVNGCTLNNAVAITDNGKDEYEGNNVKNQAKLITVGSAVNARIATSADPADWFRFTTPTGTGTYILNFTHPTASFTFNLYATGNNTPALVPVSTTATSKEYVLLGNQTYYVSVTGGLSYICYNLMVAPPTSFAPPVITATENNSNSKTVETDITTPKVSMQLDLSAKAFPNPHQGSFNLQITSPETGMAKIELFSVNGQKLQEKKVYLLKGGSNVVPINLRKNGTVLYKLQIGKYSANGKVIGTN